MNTTSPSSDVENMIDELLMETENETTEQTELQNDNAQQMGSPMVLNGECTIYEIAQIHQQMIEYWQANESMVIDADGITDADASFIQLLASFKKTVEAADKTFQILNPSEALANKLDAIFMREYIFSEPESREEERQQADNTDEASTAGDA